MKEHPILFSGPMIRAILDDKKTQTRRVVKNMPAWVERVGLAQGNLVQVFGTDGMNWRCCPYGQPGDRLWVRERWQARSPRDLEWSVYKPIEREGYQPKDWQVRYAATDETFAEWSGWNPSIHMPRWASRLTLENKGVRVERLQDISEEDAAAEGVERPAWDNASYRCEFMRLWDEINPKHPWASNPWVWVVEFKQVTP